MTTIIPFLPTIQGPFQFQPTLDNQSYNASVTWGLFGKRFYLNLYTLIDSDAPIVTKALVGSPNGIPIQSISWERGYVSLVLTDPHSIPVGTVVTRTVSGCLPSEYNGTFKMLSTSSISISYSLQSALPQASNLGAVSSDINLIAGYNFSSTLVYRAQSRQFEINP